MAAAAAAPLLLLLAAAFILISPALSQPCKSQTFSGRSFPNCSDLGHLNATLHWALNASASTISIAFTAPPPSAGGWVAYGFNQFASGMAGTQALLAFAGRNGSLLVRTYNITSAGGPINESAIGYPVLQKEAISSGGNTTIFATMRLPLATAALNHTWQVGSVTNDVPQIHAMEQDNLQATGRLNLAGGAAVTPAGSPAPAGTPGSVAPAAGGSPAAVSPGPAGGSPSGGGARVSGSGFGLYGGGVFVLLFVWNFGF